MNSVETYLEMVYRHGLSFRQVQAMWIGELLQNYAAKRAEIGDSLSTLAMRDVEECGR